MIDRQLVYKVKKKDLNFWKIRQNLTQCAALKAATKTQ